MMKYLVLALVLAAGSFATAATRGYLYTDRRGELYFDGLNDNGQQGSGFLVKYAISRGSLTEQQLAEMDACMSKKETHAIQIVETITKVAVPTGIPGRNTTISHPTYSVECVSAPGFLAVWRNKMGN